jgi:hypothetical protein
MFEVTWREGAMKELADAYVGADLTARESITADVLQLNQLLADDPMGLGESRAGDRYRIAFLGRVSVTFDVDPADRTVRVHHFRAS